MIISRPAAPILPTLWIEDIRLLTDRRRFVRDDGVTLSPGHFLDVHVGGLDGISARFCRIANDFCAFIEPVCLLPQHVGIILALLQKPKAGPICRALVCSWSSGGRFQMAPFSR